MAHAHGSFQAPATTGTQAITGLGFQPSLIILTAIAWGSKNADNSGFIDMFAFSDGTNEYCISTLYNVNGTEMMHEGQNFYTGRHDGTLSASPTDVATLQSLDSDGFTVNWTSKTSAQFHLYYIALEGVTASKVLLRDTPTVTGNQAYSGAGFQPTHVILVSAGGTVRGPSTAAGCARTFRGISDGTNEIALGVNAYRNNFSNKVISFPNGGSDVTYVEANVNSLDSDGFTLNFTQVNASVRKFTAICLSIPWNIDIGYTQKPTSTGAQGITGAGFTPQLAWLWASRDTVLGQSAQADGNLAIGVANSSTEFAFHATTRSGTLTTKQYHYSDNNTRSIKLQHPNGLAVEGVASTTSMDSDGISLNWSTADSSQPYFGYILFGNPSDGIYEKNVTTVIDFVQSVTSNFKVENPETVINLAQALVHNIALQRSVSNVINFLQRAGLTYEESVESIITFSQDVVRKHFATSVINFTQTVVGYTSKDFESIINLAQLVQYKVDRNRSLTSTIVFEQAVTYFLNKLNVTCEYSPFSGEGGVNPTPPILGSGTLTLSDGVTPLVFKNPDFGNVDQLNFTRINRFSRGGNLIVFSDPSWPKEQKMSVTITGFDEVKKAAISAFLDATLGQLITLTDYYGRDWSGIILTPDAEITQVGIDSYAISFEFEGELV